MLLLESPQAASPETKALAALMHLHAAKLPARLDPAGDLNPLLEQERFRWDATLVHQGLALLDDSTSGSVVSAFHVEAAIAAMHATASSVEDTNWDAIVNLYDRLMGIAPSPIVALNRAIAVGQRDGPRAASTRSTPSRIWSGCATIPSTRPRSASSNCVAAMRRLPERIFPARRRLPATTPNVASSKDACASASRSQSIHNRDVFDAGGLRPCCCRSRHGNVPYSSSSRGVPRREISRCVLEWTNRPSRRASRHCSRGWE
jgi:hypothetical protein